MEMGTSCSIAYNRSQTFVPMWRTCLPSATLALLLAAACDSPSEPSNGPPAQNVEIVSGDDQDGVVGEQLQAVLAARVLDAEGRPIRGKLVHFRVSSGGGSVEEDSVLTDDQGIARERWVLGTVARDTQKVEAHAVNRTTGATEALVVFSAVGAPGAAAAVVAVGDGEWIGPAGSTLADSIEVRVVDRYQNAVPGATVQWSVRGGGGTLSPATAATDATGIARSAWTLGPRLDADQVVEAAVGAGIATSIHATASVPSVATAAKAAGDGQSASVTSVLPTPLAVVVTMPDGSPVVGARVTWQAGAAGGAVDPGTTTTDAQGRTEARWTLGTTAGSHSVSATIEGLPPITFAGVASAGFPQGVVAVAGDGQGGRIGATLVEPLAVRVVDEFGNGVPGVDIGWEVEGGGSLSASTTRSGSGGMSTVRWTLGASVGTQTVTARSAGTPATFSATASSAPVASISVSPADPTLAVGATLQITATPISDVGDPLPGRPVEWSSSAPAIVRVDGRGLLTGVTAGSTSVVVLSEGVRVEVDVTVTSGSTPPAGGDPATAVLVEGEGQTGPAGQELPQQLVARVVDSEGNPVDDAFVFWLGDGEVFANVTDTTEEGVTRNYWTLGAAGAQRLELWSYDFATMQRLVLLAVFTATAQP